MKATKGEAGYIQARKKQLILKAVLEFGIVIALLILGIWQTHTRLNLLTVVAVLGCLPAAKSAGGGNHKSLRITRLQRNERKRFRNIQRI